MSSHSPNDKNAHYTACVRYGLAMSAHEQDTTDWHIAFKQLGKYSLLQLQNMGPQSLENTTFMRGARMQVGRRYPKGPTWKSRRDLAKAFSDVNALFDDRVWKYLFLFYTWHTTSACRKLGLISWEASKKTLQSGMRFRLHQQSLVCRQECGQTNWECRCNILASLWLRLGIPNL